MDDHEDVAPTRRQRRTEERSGRPARHRRRRLLTLLLGLALLVVAADQSTKLLAERRLEPGENVEVLGSVLSLQLVYNPGAAFSLATGMTWVFTLAALVVTVVVLRISRRIGSATWAVALGLLLGGSIGNLYDRLFRPPGVGRGHVVDFINYNGYFVGNVADIAIVAAAILIALLALRGREVDGSLASESAARERSAATPAAASPEEERPRG